MTVAENRALVQQFVEEDFNTNNLDAIPDFFVPGSLLAGGFAGQMMVLKTAFPDIRFSITELVAEDDKVVAFMTTRGTNSGPLAGLPGFGKLAQPVHPTGQLVTGTTV